MCRKIIIKDHRQFNLYPMQIYFNSKRFHSMFFRCDQIYSNNLNEQCDVNNIINLYHQSHQLDLILMSTFKDKKKIIIVIILKYNFAVILS